MVKKYLLGFTLIELLITLSIIVFLAVIIMSAVMGSIYKGNDAKRKADLNRIKIALDEYEQDHNCYPNDPAVVSCKPTGTGLKPYLNKIPCDPTSGSSYGYEHASPTSSGYTTLSYRAYDFMESGSGGLGNYNFSVPAGVPVFIDTGSSYGMTINATFSDAAQTQYYYNNFTSSTTVDTPVDSALLQLGFTCTGNPCYLGEIGVYQGPLSSMGSGTVGPCSNWFKIYAALQNVKDPSVTPNIGPGGLYNFVQGSDNAPAH